VRLNQIFVPVGDVRILDEAVTSWIVDDLRRQWGETKIIYIELNTCILMLIDLVISIPSKYSYAMLEYTGSDSEVNRSTEEVQRNSTRLRR